MPVDHPSLEEFARDAAAWLDEHAPRRPDRAEARWGEGSDVVALFRDLSFEEEQRHLEQLRRWQRQKQDAGFGSITWPTEVGGGGLTPDHRSVFQDLEARHLTPTGHEALTISMELVAATILSCGSDELRSRHVRSLRRADTMCCQMLSEPDAGSDLGNIGLRAVPDGDDWLLDGQKIWTSGAQFADHGYVVCRSDPDAPKQAGLTAFVVPMDSPGLEVRPIRQMSGGASFNEVFFDSVRVPDAARLGDIGAGWRVLLTTLGFERASANSDTLLPVTDLFERLVAAARHFGRDGDANVRQELARAYTGARLRHLNARRATTERNGAAPGPETSLLKLGLVDWLGQLSHTAALVLGPRLVADDGGWGTFAWSRFVTGAPGHRVGGGTDEIQRNTLAEHALGLPR